MRRQNSVGGTVVAAVIACIAALALWESRAFSMFGSIFPRTAGIVLLAGSLFVLWRELRGTAPPVRDRPSGGLARSVGLMVVMLAWIALLEWGGFALTSWAAFVALALIASGAPPSGRRVAIFAASGLVMVVGMQLLFQRVLSVRLPAGVLLPGIGS